MFNSIVETVTDRVETVIAPKFEELKDKIRELVHEYTTDEVREKFGDVKRRLTNVESIFHKNDKTLDMVKQTTDRVDELQDALDNQSYELKALKKAFETISARVGQVAENVDALTTKVQTVNNRADQTTQQWRSVDLRIDRIASDTEKRLDELEKKAGAIRSDLSSVTTRVDEFGQVLANKIHENNMVASLLPGSDSAVMARGVKALKRWTLRQSATVVYDSTVGPFTADGLFDKVRGKPDIALVAFTTDGDVFGGFYSVSVTKQKDRLKDPNLFVFSFESHGRCMTPQRFVAKVGERHNQYVCFLKNSSNGRFVDFGGSGGWFYLGSQESKTFCYNLSQGFEDIEDNTLAGKPNGESFTCSRLVALQLV